MIHQSTSLETVIYETLSKLGVKNQSDLPMDDIISWAIDALSQIGGLSQYEEVENYELTVVNYKAVLPENLYEITNCSSKPFKTKKNTVIVGINSGTITINYLKHPLGENGWPLVPDDVSYREAITWYIAQWLSVQGRLPNPRLTPEYCSRKWQWYCGQARAESIAPTPDQLERMVNVFRRLVPMSNQFENNFAGLNNREHLFRHDPNNSRWK